MATFTISSGGVVEWDSLSGGSTNATRDTYNISAGSTLRIACDTYQCAGHSTAFGSLDNVSWVGTGGTLLIDSTQVRVVPYNTGTGNVPAIGVSITQGAVSGALLGVWADWQSEPVAAGAAMPTTGHIKLKSVSGGAFAAGALTGIGASATGPDVQGWIEVRGSDSSLVNVSRLGLFKVTGAWFDLGETSGVRGQILQCPTTGVIEGVLPAVWVETAPASGVYEQYPCVGTLPAASDIPTDAERGKVVWQPVTGVRFGSDGTNNVGYLPPAGCKVRVPAAMMTCCARTAGGSGPRVVPNSNIVLRQRVDTTNIGSFNIEKATVHWYVYGLTPTTVRVVDSGLSTKFFVSQSGEPPEVSNVVIGNCQVQSVSNGRLDVRDCAQGGVFEDVTAPMSGLNATLINLIRNNGLVLRRPRTILMTSRTATSIYNISAANETDLLIEDPVTIGGKLFLAAANVRPKIKNQKYADVWRGTTTTAAAIYSFEMSSGGIDPEIEGFELLGPNLHARAGTILLQSVTGGYVRNIGSSAAPVNLGTANKSTFGIAILGCNGTKVQRVWHTAGDSYNYQGSAQNINVLVENYYSDEAKISGFEGTDSQYRSVRSATLISSPSGSRGQHFLSSFTSDTAGLISVRPPMEASAASAAFCVDTGGTPLRSGAINLFLFNAGDQVTWEMPYFALGHTGFAASNASVSGTNTPNHLIEFQYDLGAGFNGTWLTANSTNLSGVGAIDPAVGVKVKIRATCVTANAANALTSIGLLTTTTLTAQNDNLYPLDSFTLTLTNLVVGSAIRIETAAGATRDFRIAANTTESFSLSVFGDAQDNLRIKVRKGTAAPFYQPYETQATAVVGSQSIFIAQTPDE